MSDIHYHSLRFRNGYAYRECEIPFEDQGLVLVRGLNVDDGGFLGAGKTSPFEVFSLLQTGRVGKQRKGERILADDVVNLSVGGGFEARLRFDVDERPYEIVQYRQHPKFGNAYRLIDLDVGRNIIPSKNQRPQSWVAREVLRVDEKSFFNLIYLAQDFSNVMLSGTDGDRQQSLIQMFGLDAYDTLRERVKAKLSVLRRTAQDVETLQEELEGIEADLQQYRQTPAQLEIEVTTKEAELLEVRQRHDSALDSIERVQHTLRDVEQRSRLIQQAKRRWNSVELPVSRPKDVTDSVVAELQTEADSSADAAADLRNSIRLLEQRHIIKRRLETLPDCDEDEARQELEETRDELRRLTNQELPRAEQRVEISADLRRCTRPSRSADEAQQLHDEASGKRRDAERDIASISTALESEVCPTCGQALEGSNHDPKELKQRLRSERRALKRWSGEVHDLAAELGNARTYEELQGRLKTIPQTDSPQKIQRRISHLMGEEKKLVTCLESAALRETLQQQLASLPRSSAAQLKKRLRKAEQATEQLRRQQEAAASLLEKSKQIKALPKGDAAKLRRRITQARTTVRQAADAIVRVGEEVNTLKQQHTELQRLTGRRDKIERGLRKTREVRTNIRQLQALETAFGSKGLKRDRFAAILRDAAQQTVPYYTNLLWPRHNSRIDLVDGNTAVKFQLSHGDLVTGSRLLSGGERNKAGLALLFGLRDLKEKYTGLRTNVLIVDEPFGNLDAYGTDALIRVLRDLRTRFGTVLVVGNQRDVLEHGAWDQVWWAVRKDHEARLYRRGLPAHYLLLANTYTQASME